MRVVSRLAVALVLVSLLLAAALAAAVVLMPMPEPNDSATAQATEVLYADGSQVGEIGTTQRISIPLGQVPDRVQQAVLAAEDRNFYRHVGFSPTGIARAVINNASGGELQGGSTITQQYVKNAFLSHDQTLRRKAEELLISLKVESTASKDQILEGYLNTIYFGRGAYGIESAARVYFGRGAADLNLSQGAALAAIIRSPGNLEPSLYPERLQRRWEEVLAGMRAEKWISAKRLRKQAFPEFIPPPTGNRLGGHVGHVLEQARRELVAKGVLTEAQVTAGGYRITTTIDPSAQAALERAVVGAGPQTDTEGLRIGAAVIDPDTGAIVAMYAGPDYVDSQFNNATQARAQAGSIVKAFGLVAAFEQGIGPDSLWDGSSPRSFGDYRVPNEGNVSYGTITLREATQKSVNTVFVDLADYVGVDRVMDAAFRAGIPEDTPGAEPGLPFVLGAASPTVLDVTTAYATLAARGVHHEPTIVERVERTDGTVVYDRPDTAEQVLDTVVADNVTATLQSVVTGGSGWRAAALGRPAAGKTGTTDDNLSAWFAGYTPQAAMAVMLAKEDAAGNPVTLRGTGGMDKVFGGSFPAAIWTAFMREYLDGRDVEYFAEPVPPTGSGRIAPALEPTATSEPSPQASQSPSPAATSSATVTPSGQSTATPPGGPDPAEGDTAQPVPDPGESDNGDLESAGTPRPADPDG